MPLQKTLQALSAMSRSRNGGPPASGAVDHAKIVDQSHTGHAAITALRRALAGRLLALVIVEPQAAIEAACAGAGPGAGARDLQPTSAAAASAMAQLVWLRTINIQIVFLHQSMDVVAIDARFGGGT